jgi:hypothetical protein
MCSKTLAAEPTILAIVSRRRMASSHQKGAALERAVRAIEEIVFKNQPNLGGRVITVRANRHINDRGVSHEIDLIVIVNEGTPNQELHAYECKNRKTPADKNDVIIFGHKMRILGAQTGTIVARKFTADAVAQAKQAPMIKLFRFTDDFRSIADELHGIATSYDIGNVQTTLHYRHPAESERTLAPSSVCVLRSETMSLLDVIRLIVDEHFKPIRQRDELVQLEGLHNKRTEATCQFDPGELIVDGHDIQYACIVIPYLISVRHTRLEAKFNVERRGGHYKLVCEKDPFEGKVFSVEIVTKPV